MASSEPASLWSSRADRFLRAVAAGVVVMTATSCTTGGPLARRTTLVKRDVAAVPKAIRDADATDWKRAAAVAAAVAATVALDDGALRASQQGSDRADRIATAIEPFGGRYGDRVLAGFLLGGAISSNQKAREVAFDGFIASILATKVVTPLLKQAAGRIRPNAGDDTLAFGEGGDSFPSNHATHAFAIASVIAAHYDAIWIDAAAYGVASAVGWSRMRHDAHYLSDVAAGAVIGMTIGRVIVSTNDTERRRWSVIPVVAEGRPGVMITLSF